MKWSTLGGYLKDGYNWAKDGLDSTKNEFRGVDPDNQLGSIAGQAQQGYNAAGQQLGQVTGQLQRQASGQDSLSQLQLGQALAQNMSAQRSMAASASPGNQAGAARTAAIQNARMSSGLAGQQAVAGIQERAAALQMLGQILGQERAQGLQGALGGYGALENARANRFGVISGQPSMGEKLIGFAKDAGAAYATGGASLAGRAK